MRASPHAVLCLLTLLLTHPARLPAQPPAEKPKITISIGTFVTGYLPLPLAEALGYFKDEGLDVQIQVFGSGGSKSLQAVVGGSSDFAIGSYDHTIQMQAQGKELLALVLLNRNPGTVLGVRADLADKIKTLKDLQGQTVGVTAPGSHADFFVRYLMGREGLKGTDVSFIGIGGGSTAVAAVERKAVAAVSNYDPAITILERRGLIKLLVDARTHEGAVRAYGGDHPFACLYANRDFVEKNPVTAQKVVNALLKTLRWMRAHSPEEIAAKLPKEYVIADPGTFVQIYQESRDLFSEDGRFVEENLATVQRVLGSFDEKIGQARIDLSRTYTNRFVEAVPQP